LPDGNIEFLGRIDYQVKIRGFRIELGEIESRLLTHEAIKEAVAVASENQTGDKSLCAYIVAEKELTVVELRDYLGQALPEYMIPSYFVQLPKMPLNQNGKVDRKALPEPDGTINTGTEYVAPADEIEAKLAEIWREVLGVERVGVNDNFFELGGDSIKAIQIIARLKKYQLDLEIKNLFLYQIIKELKHHIRQDRGLIIDQGIVTGEIELTPIQEWFFKQKIANSHHFNQAIILCNRNGFDKSSVQEVFMKLWEHHDALRTVYRAGENRVSQYIRGIDEGELLTIKETDLTGKPELKERIAAEMNELHQSFDLAKGPLVKVKLFKTGEKDYLGMVIHHLIVDGVSWRILLEDFTIGYGQALNGEEIRFQSKTSSFKDWASRLREYATRQEILQELSYWSMLAREETLELPVDRDVTVNKNKDSEELQIELTAEETGKLLTKVNQAYNTEINDILLAALGLAVKEWTGADKILLNLEGHGREQILEGIDITRTVGWFTSIYPVILDLKQTGDLSHTIKSIKESLRRIPCRGIGYGILKYLTPEGQRPGFGFNKEPEISFNYLGEIGQENNQAGDIQMADISSGIAVSLDAKRFYKLDINGVIIGKKLTVNFSYNRHQYRRKTIAEVANHYRRYLIKIIEHCLSKPESGLTAPGLNPLWQKTIPVAEDLTGRITTQTNNKLENQLRAYLRKYDAPGMIVGIQPVNEKPWIFALGKADIHNNIAMNRDTCFKIGSITKTFITTIILQFVEEGRIKLDDPITAYLPETLIYKYSGYNLAGIRIRQLLNHTNGIPDFANNPDFKKLVLADNYKLWKPGELLAYGFLASPNKFSPGNDSWLYSSTGFILLGIIIENLTKISLKDNIQVRICDKLGFSHTRLLDVSPDLNNFSRCYTSDEKKDMTSFGLFAFWAAGGMISNAENLLIWLDAYLSGKLLRNNQMMFDYIDISKCFPIDNQIKVGLGIFNINGMQGHEGHGPGFQNILYRYRDVDFIIHINQDKTDPNSITSSDAFDIFNDLKNLVG
jgi:non-ribosomal peptide synthase protein (TIGR01720 family)